MRKIILFLFLVISFGLISCSDDNNEPQGPTDTRQTVFIYMPWSTNLTSYFKDNIKDFETAIKNGILKNDRILVFFMSSPTEATLYELAYEKGQNVRKTYKEYLNPAFTTSDGITSILNDVKQFAPASQYSMIVGCHGMGWLPVSSNSLRTSGVKYHWEYEGVPLTRYFGGLSSEYQTDITVFAKGISNAGMKMEYILFDDCYMSTVEVAYDLRNVTNYLIASPTEIMAKGFPYDLVGKHLVGDVDYAAICNEFYEFYKNYSTPCGTIGITKCSELDNLATIMKEINQKYIFDSSLINQIQRMDGYTPVIFFDYGDYVVNLCSDKDLLQRFEDQLERTVPYKKHTDTYYSMSVRGQVKINAYSGVTVSDPSLSTLARLKTQTAWYKATH